MTKFLRQFIAVWLFPTIMLSIQSCDDHSGPLEKQKVQFTFSTGAASSGRVEEVDLPENTRLRVSIETSTGTPVFSNHEVEVLKVGNGYMTDPLELAPGSYTITDFMIVSEGELLYATPKSGTPLSEFVTHALPYNFSVTENSMANVSMQVIDGRDQAPEAFGYASLSANVVNTLSVTVFKTAGGQTLLTEATAELRQGKKLIKSFSLDAGGNTIAFEGDQDAVYTLSVYAAEEANVKTFNFKALKTELGANPLKITLKPALRLTLESSVDEGNENEEYFELAFPGTAGTININWGDGYSELASLPYQGSHEYINGTYTAIITGDLNRITNFYGFSYGTYISAIAGLTNLTELKTYNPSWGAVPVKVDLSKCEKLETIFVEKYGAPYDPIDLRTEFKLPVQHFIKEFVFYAPGLEEFREKVTAEELDVFVDNILNNATQRNIYGGRFFVTPVSDPTSETQRKLDILRDDYNWQVGLNSDEIYEYGSDAGKGNISLEARRAMWLKDKFPNAKRISGSAKMAFNN